MTQENTIYFKDLANDWLLQKQISVKSSTYAKYRNILKNHVIPEFGDIQLKDLDNRRIMSFTNSKLNLVNTSKSDRLSQKTVKDILLVVNNILKYAKIYYPNDISSFEIAYPTIPKSEIRILSVKEQRALEEILYKEMDSVKLGILICLYTGLRLGEICGLRWEDISLYDGTISIRRTVQRLQTFSADGSPKTRIILDAPKTKNSARKIPIPDFLLSIIKKHYPSCNFCFLLTGKTDQCMEPRTLENHFRSYTDVIETMCDKSYEYEYQPGKLTFHSLRHTFATRCVESGFEIKCLSEILGHANVNITLNRYVHSSIQMKRDNMNKLSNTYQAMAL